VLSAGFLIPAIRGAGPAGGAVMEQLGRVRKLPIYLMAVSNLTLLSGLALYWRDSAGTQELWMRSGPGIAFGVGGALAILAAVIGMAVNSPTARRMAALGSTMQSGGRPPAPEQAAEMGRLREKLSRASVAVAVLLVLATAAMAVARYVPS